MKHKSLAVLTSIFLLAGCGSSDHEKIVGACVEQGESEESCTCVADLAEERLAPETFAAMAEMTSAGEKASAKFLENMSITDAVELAAIAVEAGQACKITGLDGLLP